MIVGDKIWVRNIRTNKMSEVPFQYYGSDPWKAAFEEMVNKGYEFEIGNPFGNYDDSWGLYLTNPLDIELETTNNWIVENVNENIEEFQRRYYEEDEEKDENLSLDERFRELEGSCIRLNVDYAAVALAPEGAFDGLYESLDKNYKLFVDDLLVSSPEEIKEMLVKTIESKDLTLDVRVKIFSKVLEKFGKGTKQGTIKTSLNKLFTDLEGEVQYAASLKEIPGGGMIGSSDFYDDLIKNQKKAYDKLIKSLKESTKEEQRNVIERTIKSKKLTDNFKLAIIREIINSLEIKDNTLESESRQKRTR